MRTPVLTGKSLTDVTPLLVLRSVILNYCLDWRVNPITTMNTANRNPLVFSTRQAVTRSYHPSISVLAAVLLTVGAVRPVFATDLAYKLLSPSFGGTDPAPYAYAQYEFNQKQAQAATAAAAAKAVVAASSSTAASSPSQQFANSIVSQLQSLVARNVALQIANAQPGQAGSIQSDGASITYVNSDGQLTVNITTSAGTTSFSVPSIN